MTNRHWQHIKQLTQHAISVKDSDILWFFIFPNHDFEVLSFHCLATAPNLDNYWPWTHMETLTSIQACSTPTSVKVAFTLTSVKLTPPGGNNYVRTKSIVLSFGTFAWKASMLKHKRVRSFEKQTFWTKLLFHIFELSPKHEIGVAETRNRCRPKQETAVAEARNRCRPKHETGVT